jgi:hypothetical protein
MQNPYSITQPKYYSAIELSMRQHQPLQQAFMNATVPDNYVYNNGGMHSYRGPAQQGGPTALAGCYIGAGAAAVQQEEARLREQGENKLLQQIVQGAVSHGYQQPRRLLSEIRQQTPVFTYHPGQDVPIQSIEVVDPAIAISDQDKLAIEEHGQERFSKPFTPSDSQSCHFKQLGCLSRPC